MTTIDVHIQESYPIFFDQGTPNCATADPEAFFPERGANEYSNVLAKRVCKTCMYVSECRDWAVDNKEMGIWGGTTEAERRVLRRKRKKV